MGRVSGSIQFFNASLIESKFRIYLGCFFNGAACRFTEVDKGSFTKICKYFAKLFHQGTNFEKKKHHCKIFQYIKA